MSRWHIGTMGFSYPDWLGPFYPEGLAARHFLAHYSQYFNAVEVDSTFYGIPRPSQMERWTAVTPADFTFCPKTPKSITHAGSLAHGQPEMDQFLTVMRLLGQKLGVVLLQFGPQFTRERQPELALFLRNLPTDIRFAVEFRHVSWAVPETAVELAELNICLAATDYIYMPKTVQPTSRFLYLRLIGPHGQFASKDRELVDKTVELQAWQGQIAPHLPQLDDLFVFMNNDYSGFSPGTSNRFKQLVGLPVKEIRPLRQGRLF